ncbi:uncharacterized protein LOC144440211 [Glandiceps talaboti]
MESDNEMDIDSYDDCNGSSYQSDDGVGLGEACLFGKEEVLLPEELIEKSEIFDEVMSMETWQEVLTSKQRDDLINLLPSFPTNDSQEKDETLRRLFSGENFKFGNPMQQFFSLLKDGYLAPNVAKYSELCRKAKYKDYKHSQQRYYHKLLQDILISRQKLLDTAVRNGPDTPAAVKRPQAVPYETTIEYRTSKQYYRVLQECRQECGELDTSSEDEAYPGHPLGDKKKTKEHSSSHIDSTSTTPSSPRIISTLTPRPMSVSGLDNSQHVQSSQTSQSHSSNTEMTEDEFKRMIKLHRKRRSMNEHPDLDTTGINLQDVITRTNPNRKMIPPGVAAGLMPPAKKKHKDKDKLEKKKKKKLKSSNTSSISPASTTPANGTDQVKVEPNDTPVVTTTGPAPPSTPVVTSPVAAVPPSTGQAPPKHPCGMYTNFFNLLRETIKSCPNAQISQQELQQKVVDWQKSPMSMLNVWFTLRPNWSELVPTALKWLAGTEGHFTAKVEFKDDIQQWRWIDTSTNSDNEIDELWKQVIPILSGSLTVKEEKPSPSEKKEITNIPSPRMRTDYTVKATTEEEKKTFREQESRRYEQPHKAFTFKLHGYESVVGPVKGVFGKETSLNKAREHLLLVSDRPAFVTILSLVRDAAARLPNGEGTRSDICEVLKDSQFISQGVSDSQINTVVSGALDRLHYEKDPCVKYDTHKKLWIYLHRNRTETEFERIHLEYAEAARAKKAMHKPKLSAKVKTPVKNIPGKSAPLARPPSVMSEASSDSISSSNPSMEPQSPSKSPGAASMSPKGAKTSPKLTIGTSKGVITAVSATSPRGTPTTQILNPRGTTVGTPITAPGGLVKGMPTLLTFGVKEAGATFSGVTVSSAGSSKVTFGGHVPVIPGMSMQLTGASGMPGTAVLKTTPIVSSTIAGTPATTAIVASTTPATPSSSIGSVIVPGSLLAQHSTSTTPASTAVTVTTIQRPMAPSGKIVTQLTGKGGIRPTVLQTIGGKPVLVHTTTHTGSKPGRTVLQPQRMPALGKIQPGSLQTPLGIRITAQGVETVTSVTQPPGTITSPMIQSVAHQSPMTLPAETAMKLAQTQHMIGGKPVSLLLTSQPSSIPVSTITSQTVKQGTATVAPGTISFTPSQTVLPASAGLKLAVAQATEAGKGTTHKPTEIGTGLIRTTTEQQKPVGVSVISSIGNIDQKKSPVSALPMSLLLSGSPQTGQTALPKGAVPVIASPVFAGNLPPSLAGKGVILAQVPPGSKLVTAMPTSTVSLSGQKSPILVATTTIMTSHATSTPSTVVMTTQLPTSVTAVVTKPTVTKPAMAEDKKH